MKISHFLIYVSLFMLGGCASMTFTQDVNRPVNGKKIQHWHHSMINGMVEISEPANLYKDCHGKQWHSAEVEFRFKNAVVGTISDSIIGAFLFSSPFITLYSPWNVEVICSK